MKRFSDYKTVALCGWNLKSKINKVEAIIKLENAVIRQQKNTILKDVSLEIKEGEFVYLIGKVGSGKTSLLKTLYAELPLAYGKGEVAGYQLSKIKKSQIAYLRRKCGIVFQDFKLLTDRNVYANLEFVLKATGWRDKKAIKERINEVLDKVELPDKRDKFPHQLSGGEQQRIVLARALLNAPPIILADEPTGNIDPETSYRLIELLKDSAIVISEISVAWSPILSISVTIFNADDISRKSFATGCCCKRSFRHKSSICLSCWSISSSDSITRFASSTS